MIARLAAGLAALTVAACLLAGAAAAQDIRVIDGDTFEMDGEVIRLWGIDAPELDQTCEENGLPFGAGLRAREMLLARAPEIEFCEPVNRDRYGRLVANCFLEDGSHLNRYLVALGWAWDYVEFSDGAFAEVQDLARVAGVGVWRMDCIPPWEWRDRGQR